MITFHKRFFQLWTVFKPKQPPAFQGQQHKTNQARVNPVSQVLHWIKRIAVEGSWGTSLSMIQLFPCSPQAKK